MLLYLHSKFQQEILIIALVIAKFNYLTFDPLGGGQRGWGKTLTLPFLSTGFWQSWLLNIIALMKCKDHHTKKANICFSL